MSGAWGTKAGGVGDEVRAGVMYSFCLGSQGFPPLGIHTSGQSPSLVCGLDCDLLITHYMAKVKGYHFWDYILKNCNILPAHSLSPFLCPFLTLSVWGNKLQYFELPLWRDPGGKELGVA